MNPIDFVLKHYQEPYHRHIPLADCLLVGRAENPLCNDWIQCWVRVSNERIVGVWWQGEGCCFSQAAASMLAEHLEGLTLERAKEFDEDDMLDLFAFDIDPERTQCVVTALHSFWNSLETTP